MRYADWAPTGHDVRGLCLPDRQDWLVAPVIQTRDSGPLEASNFAVAEAILEAAGDVEVHRFGHWACGWLEIILCHPSLAPKLAEIEARLEDYLVLDGEDLGQRENELASECWGAYGACDIICGLDASELVIDYLGNIDPDTLWEWLQPEYSIDGQDVSFDVTPLSRDDIARFVRERRRLCGQ
jgi:hypothetical protein